MQGRMNVNQNRLFGGVLFFVAGLLFAAGLVISGMTKTEKVIGFLDFFGDWDPSLAGVMGGAVATHFLALRFFKPRTPVFAQRFLAPTRREIDARLILGALLFGVGWAMVGFCPGPALTSLVSAEPKTWGFVASMVMGMWGFSRAGFRQT